MESLVSSLQQNNQMWADWVLGSHSLCFLGPLVWQAGVPAWMNDWKQGQDEGEGDSCGLAGDMGATEGADLYSTFFFSKFPPMPSCPRQSGNTTRQLLITIYTLFHKKVTFIGNFLLAPPKEGGCSQNPSIPWVRKEPACPKAEHTHACFIHQFSQINWQYLFSSYCRVGAGECQNQMCKIPSLPLRRSLFCLEKQRKDKIY